PIPWEHRREIGRWKAFWRTVLLVTFRPARIARAVGGPVDEIAARRFGWVVRALVALGAIWFYGAFLGFARHSAWRFNAVATYGEIGPKWEFFVLWSAGATVMPV